MRLSHPFLALVVLPASQLRGIAPNADIRQAETVALWEAAVRWALESGEAATATSVFLRVDHEADPPEALLERLKDVPKVRKVSECPYEERFGKPFPIPPKGAVVLSLGPVAWSSTTRAGMWVVHLHGPTSGTGCLEEFERTKKVWRHRINEGVATCGVA